MKFLFLRKNYILGFSHTAFGKNCKILHKYTNEFLRKLKGLGQLPENLILCTVDAVDLYPNIRHEEDI